MLEQRYFRFHLGGNRSGKSEGGAQVDVVYALGRQHPAVRAWARNNGIPLEDTDVPEQGGEVWAVALTSADSLRYVRPAVERYLPPGSVWSNRHGNGEAHVDLPGGGRIRFKSVDQGERAFQGSAVVRIRFDEEPDNPRVVAECKMRIVDRRGHLAFTMTPLKGWTALLKEYLRRPRKDVSQGWLSGMDNPHVPMDVLLDLVNSFGAHERDARLHGAIVALEGRVFTALSRHLHMVPAFDPPPEWPRMAAVDFGTRNPTGVVWGALDEADDVLHLYREHYQAERTQTWHVQRFRRLSGQVDDEGAQLYLHRDPQPGRLTTTDVEQALLDEYGVPQEAGEGFWWVVADPEDRGARLTWAQGGVVTVPAVKAVREGINAVAQRLQPDAEGRPHLVVHDSCPHWWDEAEGYVWDTGRSKGDAADKPLKQADHLLDATRYLCLRLQQLLGAPGGGDA